MSFHSFIIIFMKKLELLAPVGNYERLEAAINYGADAVYFGGTRFGLRAFANKFDEELMTKAVNFCHKNGVKAYITVNILAHNADFEGLVDYLKFLESINKKEFEEYIKFLNSK